MIVGSRIFLPVLITIFIPSVLNLILAAVKYRYYKYKANKTETLKYYLKNRIPNPFILEEGYAVLLSSIFVSFTFGTGLPILYLFLLGIFIVYFWMDKIICLRFAGKPPQYDESLILKIIKIIPAALIIHMLFGIFTFSETTIFSN